MPAFLCPDFHMTVLSVYVNLHSFPAQLKAVTLFLYIYAVCGKKKKKASGIRLTSLPRR